MNFEKSFDSYKDSSTVQKKVAENLFKLLDQNSYDSILEIGAGTGNLTNRISSRLNYERLTLNDKFKTCNKFLEKFSKDTLYGDIEKIKLENKYDLIISSSVFQWIEDFESLIKKISEATENLYFSIYIVGNLIEIKNHFGVSLKYRTTKEIIAILEKYFREIESYQEEFILNFSSPREALRSLSDTGVTNIGTGSISKIKTYRENKLTYKVAYFKCKKEA